MIHQKKKQRSQTHNVKLSKSLSWLLRHGLVKEGFDVREDGFVFLEDVLKHPKFKGVSVEQVQELVRDNDKKRFLLQTDSNGKLLIRANQGHSKAVAAKLVDELMLDRITQAEELPECIHGTYQSKMKSILARGLSCMNRKHIHFAQGLPDDGNVISGMRGTCDVIIYLNVPKVLADGIPIFRSTNGVILSPGIKVGTLNGIIPPLYFAKVVDRATGKELNVLQNGDQLQNVASCEKGNDIVSVTVDSCQARELQSESLEENTVSSLTKEPATKNEEDPAASSTSTEKVTTICGESKQ